MNMEIQAALDVADETDSFLQITDVIYDKEADIGYDALSEAEKTVFCIDGLLREMENGGFSQFVHHDIGARIDDTLLALRNIKSKDVSPLFEKFLALFDGQPVPRDEDDRIEMFESIENEQADVISSLDDDYYDTTENLVGLTLGYVSRHLKDFR
ncbi:MAG: hypothetical protein CMI09_13680 [Oceanospirillaceae bacterium]|nr:hypothetical protein [Oceanospirillaceae bacterium]